MVLVTFSWINCSPGWLSEFLEPSAKSVRINTSVCTEVGKETFCKAYSFEESEFDCVSGKCDKNRRSDCLTDNCDFLKKD